MQNIDNRLLGAVTGLCIGDALGVPYEFHSADQIPLKTEIEYTPPIGFRRSHSGVPPGTWSDDGAQALCLLVSLLDCGVLDTADFARRMVNWRDTGYMTVDGNVFDIGITTNRALSAVRNGVPPLNAGPSAESDNGNGSLMRVLPLALWHKGSDSELVREARLQSRVTHGHLRAQLCCAFYCLWARNILNDSSSPWDQAVDALRGIVADNPSELKELEIKILAYDAGSVCGSGYVVDCLMSARLCLQEQSFEDVVRAAIRLGNDTDTTACVAGGLAGLRDGLDSIPVRWREGLRGAEIVEGLATRLLVSRHVAEL